MSFLVEGLYCSECDSRKIGSECVYNPPKPRSCQNEKSLVCVITKFLNKEGKIVFFL